MTGPGRCSFLATHVRCCHGSTIHCIYTRTGDDGTTGLSDFSRVSKTMRGLRHTPTATRPTRPSASPWRWASPDPRMTTVLRQIQNDFRRRRGPVDTGRGQPRVSAAGSPRDYVDRLKHGNRVQRATPALNRSSAWGRAFRPCSTSQRTVARAPSGRLGTAVIHWTPSACCRRSIQPPVRSAVHPVRRVANPGRRDVLWQPGGGAAGEVRKLSPAKPIRGHALRRQARGEGRDSSQDRNAVNAPRSSASSGCAGAPADRPVASPSSRMTISGHDVELVALGAAAR